MLAPVVKYKYMKTQSEAPTTVKLGVSRQVVIPKKLHDRLGLKPGDYLEVEEQQGQSRHDAEDAHRQPRARGVSGKHGGFQERQVLRAVRHRGAGDGVAPQDCRGRVERGRPAAGRCGSFTPPGSRRTIQPRRRMCSAHSTSRSGDQTDQRVGVRLSSSCPSKALFITV